MIRLDNIRLGYQQRTLVEGATGVIRSGELTALVGRNGSGKSTLLRTIASLQSIVEGNIYIGDKHIASLSPIDMARSLAFVTTEKVRISNLRCRDVVALGRAPYTNWIGRLQEQDEQIVLHALESVGMLDYADKTMDRMSDGECQRIMIARALAQATPIILLDEPTAFLDMPNRYELCSLLRKLAHEEQKCILFSTHELDIALELCDSVALISPPALHILPTEQMIHSGEIERLFSSEIIAFDATSRTVKIK